MLQASAGSPGPILDRFRFTSIDGDCKCKNLTYKCAKQRASTPQRVFPVSRVFWTLPPEVVPFSCSAMVRRLWTFRKVETFLPECELHVINPQDPNTLWYCLDARFVLLNTSVGILGCWRDASVQSRKEIEI